MKNKFKIILLSIAALCVLMIVGRLKQDTTVPPQTEAAVEMVQEEKELPSFSSQESKETKSQVTVTEDGTYSTKDEVALYIHTYGKLPSNFITKEKAIKAGWESGKGNLWEVLPGKSIGGGSFYNQEGLLPEGEYKECDINYSGGKRGAERIVYGEDGSVYYTGDHYQTFEKLY